MIKLSLLKCKGVIIKTQDYRENDKIVWIFTDKFGKISAIARGAKKSKNKLFSTTLELSYCEFLLYKGKGMSNIQEAVSIKSFQGLLGNLDKLIFSSYMCELIDIALVEEEQNFRLFKEFITTLFLLDTDAIDYQVLVRAFEIRLLENTGYGLNLDACVICKSKITVSDYISLSYFGGVCDKCNRKDGIHVSKGTYNSLKFLSKMELSDGYKLKLSDDIKMEIEKVTTLLISTNFAKKPKSLEMLKFLKE